MQTAARENYGWLVVAISAYGAGIGLLGLPLMSLGVFVAPLHHEFGWTRTQIAGASICVNLATILAAPFMGQLCDRIGTRLIAMWSLFGLGTGFFLLTLLRGDVIWYYVVWLFLSFAGVGTTGILWARAVNTWFDKRRGFALGVMLSGIGLCTLFAPAILTSIILAHGWRAGYIALGIVAFGGIPLVYLFFFERHEKLTRTGRGADLIQANLPVLDGYATRSALSDSRFWLMGIGFLLVITGFGGFLVHLIPLTMDAGISAQLSARLFGLIGLAMIFGRLLIGTMLDRFNPATVCFAVLWTPAIACWLLLSYAGTPWGAGVSAFIIGFVMGAESDMIPYLVSRYFGLKAFGAIYGCQLVFFGVGSGSGAILAGLVHSKYGSYAPALWAGIAFYIVGALLVGLSGRKSHQVNQPVPSNDSPLPAHAEM